VLKDFCDTSLGLVLTKQEYSLVLSALSPDAIEPNHGGASASIIDGSKSLRFLSTMLHDIQTYGYFQQVIYLVGKCLCKNPKSRPSFIDIRGFQLFAMNEELSILKAKEDAKFLIVPYKSPVNFCDKILFQPLSLCIGATFDISDKINEESLDLHINNFIKVLNIVEELFMFYLDFSSSREGIAVHQVLADVSLDVNWLSTNISSLMLDIAQGGLLRALGLFTLRISGLDIPKTKNKSSPTRGSHSTLRFI